MREKQPISLGDGEPGTDADAVLIRLEDDPIPQPPGSSVLETPASPRPGFLFIPGALVVGPDNLLDLRIADYQEAPALAYFRRSGHTRLPRRSFVPIRSAPGPPSTAASTGWCA